MLKFILIFTLYIAVIHGNGQFSVLVSPSSIQFTGEDDLQSSYVGDVLLAALGHAVIGTTPWPGMTIQNPFSLAQTSLIIIQVRGLYQMPILPGTITYELMGSDAEDSLNYLVSQLPNETVYNIDFLNHMDGLAAFQNCFDTTDAPIVEPIEYLQPHQYWSHRHFLEELGLINYASQNLDLVLKPSHALLLRLSVDRIAKVTRFAPINEAKQLISNTIENIMNVVRGRNESVLLVQITNKHETHLYPKTQTRAKKSNNPFEKMVSDPQFPVIVNIIVWFGLAFAISVTVICYAIATMDPGRDSVIYRVSSSKEFTKKMY